MTTEINCQSNHVPYSSSSSIVLSTMPSENGLTEVQKATCAICNKALESMRELPNDQVNVFESRICDACFTKERIHHESNSQSRIIHINAASEDINTDPSNGLRARFVLYHDRFCDWFCCECIPLSAVGFAIGVLVYSFLPSDCG